TDAGLWSVRQDRVDRSVAPGVPRGATALVIDRAGTSWVGAWVDTLYRRRTDDSSFRPIVLRAGALIARQPALASADGAVWFHLSNMALLGRLNGDRLERVKRPGYYPAVDSAGSIWTARNDGLERIDRSGAVETLRPTLGPSDP